MGKPVIGSMLILVLVLVACGGEAGPAGGEGDAAAGMEVYDRVASPACGTCHALEQFVSLIGPSLANIGAEAAVRHTGVSAEDYLREAIIDPNAFVVENYAAGVMPSAYGAQLSAQQIDDLVAFLLTLK